MATIKDDVIRGIVEMRLADGMQWSYLFADIIAQQANLPTEEVQAVLDKLVGEKRISRRYSYTCLRCRLPIVEKKKERKKVFCFYCGKTRSIEQETLYQEIVYKGRNKK